MRTFLVASSKGGAGKTTLATNLAAHYALAGKRTVLADADPQLSATRWGEKRAGMASAVLPVDGSRKGWEKAIPGDTQVVVVDAAAGDMAEDLEAYLDRADAVNFGRRLFKEPPAMVPAHSVLHVFGTDDTYAPVQTQRTYALSAGFPVLTPVVDNFMLTPVMAPVSGNIMVGGVSVTALEAQFAPSGYDGHFVSTQHMTARRLIQQMLGTFARDGLSTVGP